jgi:20S proteasome alpha/beta subunit
VYTCGAGGLIRLTAEEKVSTKMELSEALEVAETAVEDAAADSEELATAQAELAAITGKLAALEEVMEPEGSVAEITPQCALYIRLSCGTGAAPKC